MNGIILQSYFFALLESSKIDTHEHLLSDEKFLKSPDILLTTLETELFILDFARDNWKNFFNFTREELLSRIDTIPASSFYRYLIQAFQFMCGFPDDSLTLENWESLFSTN